MSLCRVSSYAILTLRRIEQGLDLEGCHALIIRCQLHNHDLGEALATPTTKHLERLCDYHTRLLE